MKQMPGFGEMMKNLAGQAWFVNGINDLDVLYEAARQNVDPSNSNVYYLLSGSAGDLFGSFQRKWGASVTTYTNGTKVMQSGSTTMILRRASSSPSYPTIEIQGPFGASTGGRKIRFGSE